MHEPPGTRPVPGLPHYRVCPFGTVYVHGGEDWRVLLRRVGMDGHLYVTLHGDGVRHRLRLEDVVVASFLGPCPEGKEVRHRNGVQTDCRVDNLMWAAPEPEPPAPESPKMLTEEEARAAVASFRPGWPGPRD
jgi:hypothetical protein